MSMKHTPGPWTWGNYCEEVAPGAEDCCELVAYGTPDKNGTMPIMDVLHLADDCSITEGNGRLIAAAPELLAALKTCREYVEHDGCITIIDNAIEKAEGKGD